MVIMYGLSDLCMELMTVDADSNNSMNLRIFLRKEKIIGVIPSRLKG